MESEEKTEVCYLGEVRGNGSLLFKIAAVEGVISIILKRKGDADIYCIPVYILLEPFVNNAEEIKRCARVSDPLLEENERC